MSGKTLKEFKASGEDSSVMEPVATGSTKRPKDVNAKQDPPSMTTVDGAGKKEDMIEKKPSGKAPARHADSKTPGEKTTKLKEMISVLVNLPEEELSEIHSSMMEESEEVQEASAAEFVREDFDRLFEGSNLDEKFTSKLFTIFEGAVIAKVLEETDRIEAEMAEAAQQLVDEEVETLKEAVTLYLDDLSENWLEENKVAISNTIRVEGAEAFMEDLRQVFVEHQFEVPESKIDLADELAERVADLEESYNAMYQENLELKGLLEESAIDEIVENVCEGLVQSQREKFGELAKKIQFENVEELQEKLEILKESTFGNSTKSTTTQELNEEYEGDNGEDKPSSTNYPQMEAYVAAASKTTKK